MQKTFMANAENTVEKWYLVDAAGIPLGRLASQVASILRGKNLPTFTPHADPKHHVIVINSDMVVLTGKKLEDKYAYHYSGYVGGMKQTQYKKLMAEKSDFVITKAVKGMLPKTRLGRSQIIHLRVFKGAEHIHSAQKPEVVKLDGGKK